MSNLAIRLVSAFAIVGLGLFLISFSLYTRWLWIGGLVTLGAWEYFRMVDRKFQLDGRLSWLSALFVLCLLVRVLLQSIGGAGTPEWILPLVVCITCIVVLLAFLLVPSQEVAVWTGLTISGILFFGLWAGQLFAFPGIALTPGWPGVLPFLLLLFCTTAADTGAYFSGRALGRHPLAPSLSPKKTIEGAAGGVLLTVAVSAWIGPRLATGLTPASGALFGLVIALASIAGDLLESAWKRWAGVKDSSHVIPGHGGILDRFDSVFFAVPIAALLLNLLVRP